MEIKTDISFRASDCTDPDRVRSDLELLNQRIDIMAANIKILDDMIDGLSAALNTLQSEEA